MGKIRQKFEAKFKRQLIAETRPAVSASRRLRAIISYREVWSRAGARSIAATLWSIVHRIGNASWRRKTKSSRPRLAIVVQLPRLCRRSRKPLSIFPGLALEAVTGAFGILYKSPQEIIEGP